MQRVLLMTAGDASRVVRLAEEVERHAPGTKVCAIIHNVSSSRASIAVRINAGLRLFPLSILNFIINILHGGRVRPLNPSISGHHQLATKCHEAGWALCLAEDIRTPEVLEFAREHDADLGVAFGLTSVPNALAVTPKQGTVQGQFFSSDPQGVASAQVDPHKVAGESIAIQIKLLRSTGEHGDPLLARVELFRQPLDTDASLELKSNLILRDLLVQSVAAFATCSHQEVASQIDSWIHEMLPSSLIQPNALEFNCTVDQAPPLRCRSKWKLSVYSLLLLSPFVLLRNWLRRWRKQQPVLFLTSHLISDRHHRMTLPTEAFLREIQFLQRHYRIVRLSEAIRLLKSGAVAEPTVVLTFDDGYEDNFMTLRAVSEEMGVPVVMFISTEPVTEHREFTHDFERGSTGFRALTWDQIRYWSADGTEFQSHTCSHFDCGSVDQQALEKEIVESKRVLEGQLGKRVTSFAFPFGKPKNMSTPGMTIAGKAYDHFLSSFGGENFPNESENHKHLLRKHLQGNAWETELEAQGVFEIAKTLKRLLQLGPRRSDSNRIEAKDNPNGGETQELGS